MIQSTESQMDHQKMCIAEQVRRLRLDRGLSQKELAEKVGMQDTRISDLERGKGNPTLSTLVLIADALGTCVRDLFDAPAKS